MKKLTAILSTLIMLFILCSSYIISPIDSYDHAIEFKPNSCELTEKGELRMRELKKGIIQLLKMKLDVELTFQPYNSTAELTKNTYLGFERFRTISDSLKFKDCTIINDSTNYNDLSYGCFGTAFTDVNLKLNSEPLSGLIYSVRTSEK